MKTGAAHAGAVEVDVGGGDTVQPGPLELGAASTRVAQVATGQVGIGEVARAQACPGQVGIAQVDAGGADAGQVSASQVCSLQVGPLELTASEHGPFKILTGELSLAQVAVEPVDSGGRRVIAGGQGR
ncbi:hypothetical protein CKO14_02345 [Halorhodospira halophila]|nr:hypothetical protein [Halorhodospira halophila]